MTKWGKEGENLYELANENGDVVTHDAEDRMTRVVEIMTDQQPVTPTP